MCHQPTEHLLQVDQVSTEHHLATSEKKFILPPLTFAKVYFSSLNFKIRSGPAQFGTAKSPGTRLIVEPTDLVWE